MNKINKNISEYPVIVDYNYDPNNMEFVKDQKFKSDLHMEKYILTYKYSNKMEKPFCLMTHFIEISGKPKLFTNYPPSKINFCMNISSDNFMDDKFRKCVLTIFRKMKEDIMKKCPNIKENSFEFPYGWKFNHDVNHDVNHDILNQIIIPIKSCQNNVTIPISIHKGKKYNNEIVKIKSNEITQVYNNLMKELPLFLFKSTCNSDLKQIKYVGKFVLSFSAIIWTDDSEKKNVVTFKIDVKEVEIKYNISRIQSVLDGKIDHVVVESNFNLTNLKEIII